MRGVDLLSDKAIKAALKRATVEGKAVTVNDGAGLTLEAQPSGVGWWRLRYWVSGKANRLSVGTYPDTTLAMARDARTAARRGLLGGWIRSRPSGLPKLPGLIRGVARSSLLQGLRCQAPLKLLLGSGWK